MPGPGELLSTPEAKRPAKPNLPAYRRIVDVVSGRIARGEYRPGDQLPSESQFCAEFEVSPMTLRRALTILVDRGLLSAEQGRGTFVRALDLGEAKFQLQQLTDQWLDASVEVRLLAASTAPASDTVAKILHVTPGERTVYLRRLVLEDGLPTMYHVEYVVFDPRRPLVESQLQITSLQGLLHSTGGESFPRGELTVRAVNLEPDAAAALDQPAGAAAICLEHVFQDFTGQPVSWGWFLCRADRYFLRTSLGAAR